MPLRLPGYRFVASGPTGNVIWWADDATADTLMRSWDVRDALVNIPARLPAPLPIRS